MKITRRHAVGACAISPIAGCAGSGAANGLQRQLRQDVARYVDFGWHRTGWPADGATTNWIADRLEHEGFDVHRDAFEVENLTQAQARLQIETTEVSCALQWAPASGVRHVRGPLAIAGGANMNGAIVVLPTPAPFGAYWTAQGDTIVAGLARSGARALILCVDAPSDAPYLYNRTANPALALPVVIVARSALASLVEAAQAGAMAQLEIQAARANVTTRNLIAATGEGQNLIVLSTPMTGWFGCGGERGAGIALLLALAAHLKQTRARILVLCSSAHEIGHVGMDRILAHHAPPPEQARIWVHLGASIASANAAGSDSVFATPSTLVRARGAFSALALPIAQADAQTPGETGTIIAAGYERVLGFAGSNAQFHTETDDGRSIDYARLEGIFEATLQTIIAESAR